MVSDEIRAQLAESLAQHDKSKDGWLGDILLALYDGLITQQTQIAKLESKVVELSKKV